MSAAISVTNLTKRYRAFTAVDDLTLEVEAGSICGLLGPNGAGKTTTIKCLLGFARPTAGSIAVDGRAPSVAGFPSLAFVPERAVLWDELTIGGHLAVYRRLHPAFDEVYARTLLDRFSLDPALGTKKLSKGMRTAVALSLAFAVRPRVLILDEPSSGLDPIHQRMMIDLMVDAAGNGSTIIFSSHNIGHVERAAQRVAIMNHGRLIRSGSIAELTAEHSLEDVFLTAIESDVR
jgi:ABC-2 type transport system ATP-binding protein